MVKCGVLFEVRTEFLSIIMRSLCHVDEMNAYKVNHICPSVCVTQRKKC
jgi:hypothetical protein